MGFIERRRFAAWLRESKPLRTSAEVQRARQVSMLHPDTLALLHVWAGRCEGAILEIGPYIGGSTLALAAGNTQAKPHVAVEKGGAHDHPERPSRDILADLRTNLDRAGYADRVSIVVGHSQSEEVRRGVSEQLRGQKVGLLFIDADGIVGETIDYYRPLMSDRCLLVLDDYWMGEEDNVKLNLVKGWVTSAEKSGRVDRISVEKWGTWFGALRKN
jgi:predicted O-methyltransferase YrrM